MIFKEFVTKLEAQFDKYMIRFSTKIGVPFLRYAIGIIFIWFGALKMIGEISPAYDLVAATIYWLTPEIIVPLAWAVGGRNRSCFLGSSANASRDSAPGVSDAGNLFATCAATRGLLHGCSFRPDSRGSVHCEEPGNYRLRSCDCGGNVRQETRQARGVRFQEE